MRNDHDRLNRKGGDGDSRLRGRSPIGVARWISNALAEMRSNLEEIATRVPERIAADERRSAQLLKQIANLVDSVADGTVKSPAITEPLGVGRDGGRGIQQGIEESRSTS